MNWMNVKVKTEGVTILHFLWTTWSSGSCMKAKLQEKCLQNEPCRCRLNRNSSLHSGCRNSWFVDVQQSVLLLRTFTLSELSRFLLEHVRVETRTSNTKCKTSNCWCTEATTNKSASSKGNGFSLRKTPSDKSRWPHVDRWFLTKGEVTWPGFSGSHWCVLTHRFVLLIVIITLQRQELFCGDRLTWSVAIRYTEELLSWNPSGNSGELCTRLWDHSSWKKKWLTSQ